MVIVNFHADADHVVRIETVVEGDTFVVLGPVERIAVEVVREADTKGEGSPEAVTEEGGGGVDGEAWRCGLGGVGEVVGEVECGTVVEAGVRVSDVAELKSVSRVEAE